jgi:hypothetical protein
MKTKILSILLLAAVSVNLTGCFAGRSSIVASQYGSKPYDIYLNGNPICRLGSDEDCTVQTRGTRAGGQLEAYMDGQRVGSVNIHREVTFMSILFMPVTYCLSFWLYKAYPDEIEIPIDSYVLRTGNNNSGFSNGGSVWDRPYTSSKKVEKTVKPVESVQEPTEVESTYEDSNSEAEPTAVRKSVWD